MIRSTVVETGHTVAASEYEIQSQSGTSGNAKIIYNGLGTKLCYQLDGKKYELRYDQNAGIRFYYIYDEEGCNVGSMQKIRKNSGFFSPVFYYTKVEFCGENYCIYNVGMGKEGVYYPCYKLMDGKEIQVALMHKGVTVQDFKDSYTCHVKEQEDETMLLLFSVYNDFWNFRRGGKVAKKHKSTELFYSMNKREKEKYNPEFLKES